MGIAPPGKIFFRPGAGGEEKRKKVVSGEEETSFLKLFSVPVAREWAKKGAKAPQEIEGIFRFLGRVRLLMEGGLSVVAAFPAGEALKSGNGEEYL